MRSALLRDGTKIREGDSVLVHSSPEADASSLWLALVSGIFATPDVARRAPVAGMSATVMLRWFLRDVDIPERKLRLRVLDVPRLGGAVERACTKLMRARLDSLGPREVTLRGKVEAHLKEVIQNVTQRQSTLGRRLVALGCNEDANDIHSVVAPVTVMKLTGDGADLAAAALLVWQDEQLGVRGVDAATDLGIVWQDGRPPRVPGSNMWCVA